MVDKPIVMLGDEYCPNCAEMKRNKKVKAELKAGRMRYVDCESTEGKKLVSEFHAGQFPVFLVWSTRTNKYMRKSLYFNDDETDYVFKR